jgi:glycosyltransferase involved in cell wall biosynthesis
VKGFLRKLGLLAQWLLSYPGLVIRYLLLPRHDVVLVGYMGQLDVLFLWPFARIRKVPIVLDAYISLYNTIVEDRELQQSAVVGTLVYYWEWLAYRAADLVLVDTRVHAQYFRDEFRLPADRVKEVWVGAEPKAFSPKKSFSRKTTHSGQLTVLFYGAFIPLQGIDTIVHAAHLSESAQIKWILIGRGQEEGRIRVMLGEYPATNLEWIPWVDYGELIDWIQRSDVCLGIFGDTEKAARVIPNKVFQILLAGAPLVTRESPAVREILEEEHSGVVLVPPANPRALVKAVKKLGSEVNPIDRPLHRKIAERITPESIGQTLIRRLEALLAKPTGNSPSKV